MSISIGIDMDVDMHIDMHMYNRHFENSLLSFLEDIVLIRYSLKFMFSVDASKTACTARFINHSTRAGNLLTKLIITDTPHITLIIIYVHFCYPQKWYSSYPRQGVDGNPRNHVRNN
jgi:hypothetical protein